MQIIHMLISNMFKHVTDIDNYRRIQTNGVALVQCSHSTTSKKVPVNNANLGLRVVCNTNNTNICCEGINYNCVGDGYNTLHATDGGFGTS